MHNKRVKKSLCGALLSLMALTLTGGARGQDNASAPEKETGRLVVTGVLTDEAGTPRRNESVKFTIQQICDCHKSDHCKTHCKECCPRGKPIEGTDNLLLVWSKTVSVTTDAAGEFKVDTDVKAGTPYTLEASEGNVVATLERLMVEAGGIKTFKVPQNLFALPVAKGKEE